ncbi:MAG: PrsW family intramembrane metalloprotease [Thermoplasmata archaeon]
MSLAAILVRVSLLLAAAFVPSLIYLIFIRNIEKFSREPWRMVLTVFARGAFYSIIIAIILEVLFYYLYKTQIERIYIVLSEKQTIEMIVLACVVAPFVEELAKLFAVRRAKPEIDELEDGFIYGAAAGLGFAATENLLYELGFALTGNFQDFGFLVLMRSISSTLLHASASAIAGYGLASIYLRGEYGKAIFLLGGAMGLHALFNLFASFGIIFGGLWYSGLVGFVFSAALAITAIGYVRDKIRQLDMQGRY